jgi:hypothetical protein
MQLQESHYHSAFLIYEFTITNYVTIFHTVVKTAEHEFC